MLCMGEKSIVSVEILKEMVCIELRVIFSCAQISYFPPTFSLIHIWVISVSHSHNLMGSQKSTLWMYCCLNNINVKRVRKGSPLCHKRCRLWMTCRRDAEITWRNCYAKIYTHCFRYWTVQYWEQTVRSINKHNWHINSLE